MSQLGYSAVGMDFQPLPATLALVEPDITARALCVELARVTANRPLQWRMVRMIGPAIGQDETAVDAAIAYAVKQGWLLAAGNPAHSIASPMRDDVEGSAPGGACEEFSGTWLEWFEGSDCESKF